MKRLIQDCVVFILVTSIKLQAVVIIARPQKSKNIEEFYSVIVTI
ncbi:MAG: hypothetical protein V4543_12765 [Bacteroidota bacterium]